MKIYCAFGVNESKPKQTQFKSKGRSEKWNVSRTILMKLWYWVVDAKLNVQKEVKQLQLQIAELADKKSPSEN